MLVKTTHFERGWGLAQHATKQKSQHLHTCQRQGWLSIQYMPHQILETPGDSMGHTVKNFFSLMDIESRITVTENYQVN